MDKTRDYDEMLADTSALREPVRATFDAIRGYEIGTPELKVAFQAKADLAEKWAALIIEIVAHSSTQEGKVRAVAWEVEQIMTAAGLSSVRFSEYASK